MNSESHCARMIRLREGETFVSVGDNEFERWVSRLLPHLSTEQYRLALPDLVSHIDIENRKIFRLREVKFKLEERLILKAVHQLSSGVSVLSQMIEGLVIDRLEIVVPLYGRAFKKTELAFLGDNLGYNRYRIKMEDISAYSISSYARVPVTALIL